MDEPFRIHIHIETAYLEAQSEPEEQRFVFSYTITIRNEGTQAAQLVSRHWLITDSNGKTQEVRGKGVVGEQPVLEVYNKIDLAGLEPRVQTDAHGTICRVFLSAQQRLGLDGLRQAISQFALNLENNATSLQNIQSQ